jgi:hypothetical protein
VSGNPDIQPTWPLLLKTEKVDESLIFFLLNYCANWIPSIEFGSQSRSWINIKTKTKQTRTNFKKKMYDEVQILYSSTNSIWSPFKFCLAVLSSGQDGRCYYFLAIPCTFSRMQGFTCLIKPYKTNMLRLFQWNTESNFGSHISRSIIPLLLEGVGIEYILMRHQSNLVLNQGLN